MIATPVIYEVTVSMPRPTFVEHEAWLYEHFNAMLREPGFLRADVFEERDPEGVEARLTIQYVVANQKTLDIYLAKASEDMRSPVVERLGEGYRAKRRVLHPRDTLHAATTAIA